MPVFFLAFGTTLAELSWWTVFNLRNVRQQHTAQQLLLERDAALARGILQLQLAARPGEGAQRAEAMAALTAKLRPLFLDLHFGADGEVGAQPQVLEALAHSAQAHVRMFVAEGSFFAAMMVLGGALIFRALRHEMNLVRQGQNFLAAVTHELKSPLASMRLWVETLQARPMDAVTQRRCFGILLGDVDRLETLVGNVLMAARLDSVPRKRRTAEHARLKLAPVDLLALTHTCAEPLRAHAEAKNVALRFLGQGAHYARMEPSAWGLVVRNLLDNAIKYSPAARAVDIEVTSRDSAVELRVTDYGTGLAADELEAIFSKFYRVGDELVRGSQGTGLGLFLVRAVVEEYGGTVVAQSAGVGTGARFVVQLPRVQAADGSDIRA